MKKQIATFTCFVVATLVSEVAGQNPWTEPQDATAATNSPDEYAWKLFIALNWPADVANRKADGTRKFGENATAVWESWKLSSGRNDEVFLKDGKDPGVWLGGTKARDQRMKDLETLPLQQQIRFGFGKMSARFNPTILDQGNENHMNEAAYNFIRDNQLYCIEGQLDAFSRADALRAAAVAQFDNEGTLTDETKYNPKLIDFPVGAKEVKAQWRKITENDKPRFRWVEFTDNNGSKQLFGLTALHITTKDLPNWFWATFEHVDNPKRKDPDTEPWLLASRDSSAGPKGYPTGLGIEGTRWENYRLRGTQTSYNTATGRATLLANSQIENGFQTSASCMSCHALAAIGSKGERPGFFRFVSDQAVVSPNGPPENSVFEERSFLEGLKNQASGMAVIGRLRFLQEDFVWSLGRAQHRQPASP